VASSGGPNGELLLEVSDLHTSFTLRGTFLERVLGREKQVVHAVDGVSLHVRRGEVLGLVGESGSGKTSLAKTILGLARASAGSIKLRGRELTGLPESDLRPLRRQMQMVFQDPHASLNPAMDLLTAIGHPLVIHGIAKDKRAIRIAVEDALERVGLVPPDLFMGKYPSDLSGGQKQRAVLARALILGPDLIVADEPVSMLDVSIRLGVLNLLAELRDEERLAILYVTHDIASARYLADTIVVMYAGQLVESAPSATLTDSPAHPYTQLLLSAAPDPDRVTAPHLEGRGAPPSLSAPPSGCRFHPRCPFVMDICKREVPPSIAVSPGHIAACWLHVNPAERAGSENGVIATPSASMENEIKR